MRRNILSVLSGILAFFFSIGCAVFSFVVQHNSIDFSVLERYEPGLATVLLDDQGQEWTRFALDRRAVVHLNSLPEHVIHAFMAAEDWQFFDHHGISLKGIARSFLVNLYHGRAVQGASTITQQVVRLLYFHQKKTFRRKIKEQLLALLVELQFSKEQILQAYLNHVYFGCGIYGIEAAAQRFWGMPAAQITIGQAAALASVMRSPATYCPLLHPDATERRRNLVLGNMCKLGFITQRECDREKMLPVVVTEKSAQVYGLHMREHVRRFLEQQLGGQELYAGGYVVQTTMSSNIQRSAEQAFGKQIEHLKKEIDPRVEGALLTVEVRSGRIKAMIGGADYNHSKFNRALQARRQLGSLFKPLIFTAALQQGRRFSDVVIDEPIAIDDGCGRLWEPNNYNLQFNGPITLAYGLSRSNNIAAIKTFLQSDTEVIVSLAKKCRLADPMHRYPSLSLGCLDETLDKAVGMFNIFAHNGVYVSPYAVCWIKNRRGEKIYKHTQTQQRVVPSYISGQVLKVLTVGLERVRAITPNEWIDSAAASKTGTTNDWRTCWFIGSTPELTTGVYVGRDDNKSMGKNVYPLHTAFPIWLGLHREIQTKKKQFDYDPSLKELLIDEKSGEVLQRYRAGAISIYV